MQNIAAKNFNANRRKLWNQRTFKEIFKSADSSPIYQLKNIPEIYEKPLGQIEISAVFFRQNIEKESEGLYQK
jgi:hypothetical protein